MRERFSCSVGCLLLALSASRGAAASQEPPSQPPASGRPAGVIVDGSKTPELIPDRVAAGMFFSAIAIPLNADKKSVDSMKAKLARMKLSAGDMATLRKEMATLGDTLNLQRRK